MRAIELSPNWHVARGGYADLLHHAGRLEEAITQIEACIALDPLRARAVRVYASLLSDTGRLDEAIDQARRGVDLNPDYDPSWGVLVSSLSLAGHWEEAEATARRSLALRPKRAYRHLALGTLLLRSGRTEEGRAQIDQCLENHASDSGYVLMDSAWLLLYTRDYDRAAMLFLRAIEEAPEHIHPLCHLALGMIRSLQGSPEEALQALDRCQEMASDRVDWPGPGPRVLAWRGRVFVQMGELENAQDLLQRLYDMTESQSRSLSIASLLCAIGRIDETFEWLGEFLDAPGTLALDLPLFPDFDAVRSDPRFGEILERLGLPG